MVETTQSPHNASEPSSQAEATVYDEMVSGQGRVRPHWRPFLGALGQVRPDDMGARWDEARRLLRQNGVTYNVYGDPQGIERLWPLDLIPLLIPPDEWRAIEDGVTQRAALLNALAADFYGPQQLIRSGRLPAAALYGDPGFLRACHGAPVLGGTYLQLLAIDLVRLPDGGWRVMADRTNVPSGVGYALENRSIVSQVLTQCFRACDVRRLGPFFDLLQEALERLAPARSARSIVLLTPGPYNETYFEHVFLARHLGITLVEGGDLTVRDRRVYLKTLGGLEPVHVILRRLDDSFCDPLELRADSALGVPGLMRAVRAGTVTIANALGSGLLESASFMAFMPSLCRHILGQELKLPGLPTWWGGHRAGYNHLLTHLDRLVIKPAHRRLGDDPVFVHQLEETERAALIQRLKRRPWDYVGQERTDLSTTPMWDGDRLRPRPMVLRVFVAGTPSGFAVLPGGLTRFSDQEDRPVVSMQRGGGSKDTWILADDEASEGLRFRATSASTTALVTKPKSRPGVDLPSRVADGLFWVGRYAERTEGWVRVLRAIHVRLGETQHPGAGEELAALYGLANWLGMLPPDLARAAGAARGTEPAIHSALGTAVYDDDHPNSLRANAVRLHRSAHSVRDRLSLDMWRVIDQIDSLTLPPTSRTDLAGTVLRLGDLITALAAFWGLKQESMLRGDGWRFLAAGHRIERALQAVTAIRSLGMADYHPVDAQEQEAIIRPALDVLLDLFESVMTYRQQHVSAARWQPVLQLLVAEEVNPRSIAFQLDVLAAELSRLPQGSVVRASVRTALGHVETAQTHLRDEGLLTEPGQFSRTLDQLAMTLPEVSNLLAHAYFSHAFARSA